MAWPLSKDARAQAAKGDAVQLAATAQTQMWPKNKMEGCGEKRPQKCRSGEHEWYAKASRSRAGWRALCQVGLVNGREARTTQASTVVRDIVCELCSRSFRRESDKQRHKCLDERQKPVCEQRDATQCSQCQRWFSSREGLAVHRCMPEV